MISRYLKIFVLAFFFTGTVAHAVSAKNMLITSVAGLTCMVQPADSYYGYTYYYGGYYDGYSAGWNAAAKLLVPTTFRNVATKLASMELHEDGEITYTVHQVDESHRIERQYEDADYAGIESNMRDAPELKSGNIIAQTSFTLLTGSRSGDEYSETAEFVLTCGLSEHYRNPITNSSETNIYRGFAIGNPRPQLNEPFNVLLEDLEACAKEAFGNITANRISLEHSKISFVTPVRVYAITSVV